MIIVIAGVDRRVQLIAASSSRVERP